MLQLSNTEAHWQFLGRLGIPRLVAVSVHVIWRVANKLRRCIPYATLDSLAVEHTWELLAG